MLLKFGSAAMRDLYTSEKGAGRYAEPVLEAFFSAVAVIKAAKRPVDLSRQRAFPLKKKWRKRGRNKMKLYRGHYLVVRSGGDGEGAPLVIEGIAGASEE